MVAVSADDSTVKFGGFVSPPAVERGPIEGAEPPIRVLIVGWSSFGPKVVEELDQFLPTGSRIEVCVDGALIGRPAAAEIERLVPGIQVSFLMAAPTSASAWARAGTTTRSSSSATANTSTRAMRTHAPCSPC